MIIAGTGHRPQYCPCKWNENHEWVINLKENIKKQLKLDKPKAVISGMATGFDMWLAECALDLKINLYAYIPFKDQGKNWPKHTQAKYNNIKERADKILYCSENYSKSCFLKRDRDMIDNCDHVYSLLNPQLNEGGTYYTVNYAKSRNKPITNFWV